MVEEKLAQFVKDEIDLRKHINILIKRKKIILIVFFASVFTVTICSYLTPRLYQATAAIMITPSKIQTALFPTQVSLELLNSASAQRSTISLSTHKELLKSNIVLERIIDRLKLADLHGISSPTPENLSKKLSIKELTGTSMLQLKAEHSNPERAKELANAWAKEYMIYSQELISGEVKGTGEFITDQFAIAEQNLIQAEEKVKDFKDKYNLGLMEAELEIKKEKINDNKKQLINLEAALKIREDNLFELKKEIAKQDKFIVVSKAITDDALWQSEAKAKNFGSFDKKRLTSEEINPIYRDLEMRIVNTVIDINTLKPQLLDLTKSVASSEIEINKLAKTINQREFELTQLNRKVEIYKRTYDNLSAKIEEARIVKAAQLGEVKIVSPALTPKRPTGISKRSNVFAAGIIGLVVGVFLAFFMEYWEKTKTL